MVLLTPWVGVVVKSPVQALGGEQRQEGRLCLVGAPRCECRMMSQAGLAPRGHVGDDRPAAEFIDPNVVC